MKKDKIVKSDELRDEYELSDFPAPLERKYVERLRESSNVAEVLEWGLREILAERSGDFQDENAILELLTSQPSQEQVLALRPSPEFQARVSELLSWNKDRVLSRQEQAELERYLTLEHLVRLAKAHAYRQMTSS